MTGGIDEINTLLPAVVDRPNGLRFAEVTEDALEAKGTEAEAGYWGVEFGKWIG